MLKLLRTRNSLLSCFLSLSFYGTFFACCNSLEGDTMKLKSFFFSILFISSLPLTVWGQSNQLGLMFIMQSDNHVVMVDLDQPSSSRAFEYDPNLHLRAHTMTLSPDNRFLYVGTSERLSYCRNLAGAKKLIVMDTSLMGGTANPVVNSFGVERCPWEIGISPDFSYVAAPMDPYSLALFQRNGSIHLADSSHRFSPTLSSGPEVAFGQTPPRVFVTNGHFLYVIDPITHQFIDVRNITAASGAELKDIILSPDERFIYMIDNNYMLNSNSKLWIWTGGPGNGTFTSITLPGRFPEFGWSYPYNYRSQMVVDSQHQILYVATTDAHTVVALDTTTNQIIRTIPLNSKPYLLQLHPDGSKLYVLSSEAATVTVLETGQIRSLNPISTTVPITGGRDLSDTKIHHTGRFLYIMDTGMDAVRVIDTSLIGTPRSPMVDNITGINTDPLRLILSRSPCEIFNPTAHEDGNPCTLARCDPLQGGAISQVPQPRMSCPGDNDRCNGIDTCNALGVCDNNRITAINFDDGNDCTVDSCNAMSGVVTNAPKADGTSCLSNSRRSGICCAAECKEGLTVCPAPVTPPLGKLPEGYRPPPPRPEIAPLPGPDSAGKPYQRCLDYLNDVFGRHLLNPCET